MRDMQLIYASRPFGYDDLTLTSILMQARKNNARNGITGALICREDLCLQILEGPRDLVTSTFSRILRDERHVDVVNLLSSEIHRRLFPEWSMRHDPAQSWMWTPEEVARGVIGRASDQEILGIFERLARQPARTNGQLVDRSGSDIEKPRPLPSAIRRETLNIERCAGRVGASGSSKSGTMRILEFECPRTERVVSTRTR